MQSYQCHKVVHAGEIVDVANCPDSQNILFTVEDGHGGFEIIEAPRDIALRKGSFEPLGMMLVKYEGGYLSLSPTQVFHNGYHPFSTPVSDLIEVL